jgi:hypothetical protein
MGPRWAGAEGGEGKSWPGRSWVLWAGFWVLLLFPIPFSTLFSISKSNKV